MTLVLGISAFYHDSAVALIKDGEIVAAASEERFTRKKHDSAFPREALRECLSSIGAQVSDVDFVGFYEKPLLKFDRLLETYLAFAPRGYRSFAQAMPSWLQKKLHLPREIRRELGGDFKKRIVFCEHHESHAASAFFPSPFEEAAILTVDGVGEWTTTSWGTGRGNSIQLHQDIKFPHSLGLLYSAITYFCGFRVNSGEYKLMGLAPYGKPIYTDLFREKLIKVFPDGSYALNMDYFSFCHTLRMTGTKLERLLGFERRTAESPIRQQDMDLAASVQVVTEEVVLGMCRHVYEKTKLKHLCMAGGVALNCVANGRLDREGPFESIWVQPAAGDAGGSLGVALLIWNQLLENDRTPQLPDGQSGSLLGPQPNFDVEIEQLQSEGAIVKRIDDTKQMDAQVAELLASENVVGWVHGKMEFGPRALGSRSILGDPRSPQMQSTMNLKIKYRESFRPFAPAVLEDKADDCFQLGTTTSSPYMLFTYYVLPERRIAGQSSESQSGSSSDHNASTPNAGLHQVNAIRSDLPAITHLDYSARVQTVSEERHARFHSLLTAFNARTGCPSLINTSFNVRGEPIVRTAHDAFRCFMATQMDALVVDKYLMLRSDQPMHLLTASQEYLTELEPD
ncbi:MAG: carbamoyltransferase [Aureliella sp.]